MALMWERVVVLLAVRTVSPKVNPSIFIEHFVSGEKSNDPLSPDFVPSIFKHFIDPLTQPLEEETCQRHGEV